MKKTHADYADDADKKDYELSQITQISQIKKQEGRCPRQPKWVNVKFECKEIEWLEVERRGRRSSGDFTDKKTGRLTSSSTKMG